MKNMKILLHKIARFILAFFAFSIWNLTAYAQRSTEDWDLLLKKSVVEFKQHINTYPKPSLSPKSDVNRYLVTLDVFANDRDAAMGYANEAKKEGKDYYFNKFTDLEDQAQEKGNAILHEANSILLSQEFETISQQHWVQWTDKTEFYGKPLYEKAVEKKFDKNIVRDEVSKLLANSLQDLESGYTPRNYGWLYPREYKQPDPNADKCLGWVERVRKLSRLFELRSITDQATLLMNRYLKDALCLLPKGHEWYLVLAKEYQLNDAKQYIEGFYGTMYGKSEVETDKGIKPASASTIVVKDQNDNKTWSATTDNNGQYQIKDIILHDKCGPFPAEVTYEGDILESSFDGPLEKPNRGFRYNKDFKFKKPTWEAIITYTFDYSGDYQLEDKTKEKVNHSAKRIYQQIIKAKLYSIPSEYGNIEIWFQSDNSEVSLDDDYEEHYSLTSNNGDIKCDVNSSAHVSKKTPLVIRLQLPGSSASPQENNEYNFEINLDVFNKAPTFQYFKKYDCHWYIGSVGKCSGKNSKVVNIDYRSAIRFDLPFESPFLNNEVPLIYDNGKTLLKGDYEWDEVMYDTPHILNGAYLTIEDIECVCEPNDLSLNPGGLLFGELFPMIIFEMNGAKILKNRLIWEFKKIDK